MKFVRSRPWRSRGPWFSNRAGARRRGHREGDHGLVIDGLSDGDDALVAFQIEVEIAEDVVLAEAPAPVSAERLLAARVDLSGLRAIGASVPATPIDPDLDTLLSPDWFTHVEQNDDASLSRHSA